jgi:hypothetical protein
MRNGLNGSVHLLSSGRSGIHDENPDHSVWSEPLERYFSFGQLVGKVTKQDNSEALLYERLSDAKADAGAGTSDKSMRRLRPGAFVGLERMWWFDKVEFQEANDKVGSVKEGKSPNAGEKEDPEVGNSGHFD